MDCDQVFAVVSQGQDALRTVVVDLEGVPDRVVEVDRRCRVEDQLDLLAEDGPHVRVQAEPLNH